jgi:hypothetical protein
LRLMCRKFLFFLLLLINVQLVSFAQVGPYFLDYGGGLGAANYLGEIGGMDKSRQDFISDIKMSQTRPALNAFVRYKIHQKVAFKANLTGLRIKGDDKLSNNVGRNARNLHFRNDILELATTAEITTFYAPDIGNSRRFRLDFRSYIFFGVAGFYHNPKAQYEGKWVPLQPLRTEGQERPYSRFQMAIPMGLGFYYTFKRKHRFGWEFGWRKTFTDYLDDISTQYATNEQLGNDPKRIALSNRTPERTDVSSTTAASFGPRRYTSDGRLVTDGKRGDPKYMDNYFVTTLSYSYVIRGKNSFYRQQYNYILGNKRHNRKVRSKF